MSLANSGEYIGNCKFCKDHLSLNYISCFKTSHETDFYFCSLGHYWSVKDISEQPQTITNVESSDLNKVESYQDRPFNSNRDRDRPPFNRDKPFNRDRDRPPFNRDKKESKEGFYKQFKSNKKGKRKRE
jgi:hypothetical protein